MGNEFTVLCDGAKPDAKWSQAKKSLNLNLWGLEKNINFEISDFDKRLAANIPGRLRDLLHIAAYVYSADQAVSRGGKTDHGDGRFFHRTLRFAIPVRDLEFWSAAETCSLLQHVLGSLSDDTYEFRFEPLRGAPSIHLFFEIGSGGFSGFDAESIALFSGGVDSLGGAVNESLVIKRKTVLVSHRSTPKIDPKQRALVKLLAQRSDSDNLFHVPIWVNKDSDITREHTQRTRSYLYASLAAVIAHIFDLRGIHFYENGVTGMNLPISPQLIGARASRTTHPAVLSSFSRLLSLVTDRTFHVHNPFLWKTKTDIVETIGDCGAADLLKDAISCSHTWERTNQHPHCGRCFQCIGRRFAMLASKYSSHDPAATYKVDLLTGAREKGEETTLVESFVRSARDILNLSDAGFFEKFGETSRIIRHLEGSTNENAQRILDLHRRHAREVDSVLVNGTKEHARELSEGRLPDTCLIVLGLPSKYRIRRKKEKRRANVFRKDGDKWFVRFEGKTSILDDSIGLSYIGFLLRNPNTHFAVENLHAQIASHGSILPRPSDEEGLSISSVWRGEAVADTKARKEISKKLNELQDQYEIAKETQDTEQITRIAEEIQELERYSKATQGLGGRIRRSNREFENIRRSVTNAINRAREHTQKKHKPLAQLLWGCITTGSSVIYTPPDKFSRWE